MRALHEEIKKKTALLYERYGGGMMTQKQLSKELNYGSHHSTQKWVIEHGLEGTRRGKSIVYEVDQVARAIVNGRGMV